MGGCLSRYRAGKGRGEDRSKNAPEESSTARLKAASIFGTSSGRTLSFGYDSGFHALYRVGKELGRGQFGITYRCEHKESGGYYAVKTVKKKSLKSLDAIEDTKREVSILKRLAGHENIVKLHGVYEDDKDIHMVMELCEGGELFDKIIAKGHYAERDAADLVRQMLKVVAECHLNGVIHRDLKPENFLFVEEGDSEIKAIDFGLSDFFNPKTEFKDVVGSAYYVAPEVLKRRYGPLADVWSIGVIMYILLSGQPPFWGPTESGIFNEILRYKVNLKKAPWPQISTSAKDIMMRMLTFDPRARVTAAQALSHAWVSGDASDIPLDMSVINNMKEFSSYGRLKKLAIKKLAQTFTEEEIRDLKDQFKKIDKDNNGTITHQELIESVRHMRSDGVQVIPDREVSDMLEGMDSDGNGEIDMSEFIVAGMHLSQLQRRDKAKWKKKTKLAFDSLDKDRDGFISVNELRDELQNLNSSQTTSDISSSQTTTDSLDGQLEEVIKEADRDGNGKIDYEEFCQLLRSRSSGNWKDSVDSRGS
jgi:calcium-dependent protein kinase